MDNNSSLSSISSTVGNCILVNTFTGNFLIDWEYEKRLKMNILIKRVNLLKLCKWNLEKFKNLIICDLVNFNTKANHMMKIVIDDFCYT